MTRDTIKAKLAEYGLHIHQLTTLLGICRQTYYQWSYNGFMGHHKQIKDGIHKLIKSKGDDEK